MRLTTGTPLALREAFPGAATLPRRTARVIVLRAQRGNALDKNRYDEQALYNGFRV